MCAWFCLSFAQCSLTPPSGVDWSSSHLALIDYVLEGRHTSYVWTGMISAWMVNITLCVYVVFNYCSNVTGSPKSVSQGSNLSAAMSQSR